MWLRSRDGIEDRKPFKTQETGGNEIPVTFHKNEEWPIDTDETPNERLTDKKKQKILYDLFYWREWEVDSSFLYYWEWAKLYEKISNDENYPFIEIEKQCLEKLWNSRDFQKKVLEKLDYITDVWSWDGQKAIAFLWPTKANWYKWVKRNGTYILEDYSKRMIWIAEAAIEEKASNIKLWNSQILRNWKHLTTNYQNNMFLFLGGTICNMTDEQIINELKNMDNNWILSWNKILLSYFTAPEASEEISKLIEIYNSDNNKAFHENWMKMLWLSKDDFEFDTIYQLDNWIKLKLEDWKLIPYGWAFDDSLKWPFPWRIKWIIRAKRNCTVNIWNRTKEINKGQEFTLHYSRRFTKEWIEKLFKKSWCKEIFSIQENGDSIVLLKKKPKKLWEIASDLWETVSKYRDKVFLTLVLWWLLTWWVIKENNDNILQRENQRKTAYTEWEATQQSSNTDSTYYMQETNELISALQLDDLENEEYKKIIIDIFNIYVWNHIGEWVTTMDLIQWFWTEYGGMLIQRFWLNHYPYDFLTKDLVENTETFWWDVSCEITKKKIGTTFNINDWRNISYETDKFNLFEYKDKDTWEIYAIFELYIHNWDDDIPIYLATQKYCVAPVYSTEIVDEIKDTSWLDEKILENTKKLWKDFVVNILWRKKASTQSITISSESKDGIDLQSFKTTLNTVFLKNWKVYYVMTLKTMSWKTIWLASDSPNWPFTTTMFLEMHKIFSNERNLL